MVERFEKFVQIDTVTSRISVKKSNKGDSIAESNKKQEAVESYDCLYHEET